MSINKLRILLVEDDPLQISFFRQAVADSRQLASAEIEVIKTEKGFYDWLKSNALPDLIVLDVMLRYTDPSPKMELPPPDIAKAGFYRAGIRCLKELRQKGNKALAETPVVIYTILEREDLKDEFCEDKITTFLNKDFVPKTIIDEMLSSISTVAR